MAHNIIPQFPWTHIVRENKYANRFKTQQQAYAKRNMLMIASALLLCNTGVGCRPKGAQASSISICALGSAANRGRDVQTQPPSLGQSDDGLLVEDWCKQSNIPSVSSADIKNSVSFCSGWLQGTGRANIFPHSHFF